jgi:hypothetical protein
MSFVYFFFFLASHLCDTSGCLSKDHIVEESFTINNSRKPCKGVTLTIRPPTATTPAHIIKATAFKHGVNKNGIDPLKLSCRKIKIVELNVNSLNILNKIKK